MNHWLLKTDPAASSIDELARKNKAVWAGVTDPAALRNLKAIAPSDRLLVYHSGEQQAVVGLAKATGRAYPDPDRGDPRLLVVNVRFVGKLPRPVTLGEIRAEKVFVNSPFLRQGRLTVVPVTEEQWQKILELSGV